MHDSQLHSSQICPCTSLSRKWIESGVVVAFWATTVVSGMDSLGGAAGNTDATGKGFAMK